jgi:peptide chain release factor 1
LKSELLESETGHIVARFYGKGVGLAFQYEGCQHCCQRIPPTESKGRKQTSYVKVAVLPIRDGKSCKSLNEQDLEIITQRGHGKGGQHQNMTDSAVRMKHKPTGITVFINGKDQHANKREALRILTARVNDELLAKEDAKYGQLKKALVGDGNRGSKGRTYNFLESRCVDHRFGLKTSNVKSVMKGDFKLIQPRER